MTLIFTLIFTFVLLPVGMNYMTSSQVFKCLISRAMTVTFEINRVNKMKSLYLSLKFNHESIILLVTHL